MSDEADQVRPLIFGNEVVRNFPSRITVIYEFMCRRCQRCVRRPWVGNLFVAPDHPGKGWVETESGLWLCPDHAGVSGGEELKS